MLVSGLVLIKGNLILGWNFLFEKLYLCVDLTIESKGQLQLYPLAFHELQQEHFPKSQNYKEGRIERRPPNQLAAKQRMQFLLDF